MDRLGQFNHQFREGNLLFRTHNSHCHEGVGTAMEKKTKKGLLGREPVNARITRARLFSNYAQITVTERATDVGEEFYCSVQNQFDRTPVHEALTLMGDFKRESDANNTGYEYCMGLHGASRTNDGQRFADICLENGVVIGGTISQHKTTHKFTWV